MLERIINIAPGSDYQKSSAKSSQYTRNANFLHSLNSSMNDSISLSPATAYLSGIRWKLKKLNNNKEKIVVAFEFDEFEFTAALEILGATKAIDYEIRKTINKIPFVYQTVLWIGSSSMKKQSEKFEVVTHLPMLNSFLENLVKLSEYSYNISAENSQVKDAFFEKEQDLMPEFEYVNSCAIAFLEKYLSLNLNFADLINGLNNNLSLKKIQISRL